MINETTEGQEAGEQREELFFKVIEAGNKILEILAALFIILMLLYGAYSLWDTCQINRRAFISGELMKYKPAGKTMKVRPCRNFRKSIRMCVPG